MEGFGGSFGFGSPGFDLFASQSDKIFAVALAMMGLAVVFAVLRVVSRRITRMSLWWDDWLIFVALFFTLMTCSIVAYGARHDHYGTHLLATASTNSLVSFLRGLWVFQISYTLAIGVAKLSLLSLYWRIFPSNTFRIAVWITIGVNIIWMITTILTAVLSCLPVDAFWYFDRQLTARCIDSQAFFVSANSINIVVDIIVLTLPLFMIRRLHITLLHKIAVSTIFLLGIFATICSGMRLRSLVIAYSHGIKSDPTWDLTGTGVWSAVELSVSIVCACMPSMRPILRFIMHGDPNSSRAKRKFTPPQNASPSPRQTPRRNARLGFLSTLKSGLSTIDVEERELEATRSGSPGAASGRTDNAGLVHSAGNISGTQLHAESAYEADAGRGVGALHENRSKAEEVWVTQDFSVETSDREPDPSLEQRQHKTRDTMLPPNTMNGFREDVKVPQQIYRGPTSLGGHLDEWRVDISSANANWDDGAWPQTPGNRTSAGLSQHPPVSKY